MSYIFWLSIATLLYTYIGYPFYIFVMAKFNKMVVEKDFEFRPFVSVIISAYNEGGFIAGKIANLLRSKYPKGKLEILVGSDGSTDTTDSILQRLSNDKVRIFIFRKRRGKASVLNDIVQRAKGEILVFCDVRQLFNEDAIRHLVANFADDRVGCVSGELVFDRGSYDNGVSEGVGIYWVYEKLIRRCESAIHSMVGATGAIYAIRKRLYSLPPDDTILDDVYIPLAIARKGYRCIWDGEAAAYDKPSSTPREEYRRKVRTLAGNYQIFKMFKELLIPFKSFVTMPLLSHKLLRVLAPFFMVSLFVSNVFIAKSSFYLSFLVGQTLFYILAIMGSATYKKSSKRLLVKVASTIYMFCLMNFTAIVGLYRFVLGRQKIAWEK